MNSKQIVYAMLWCLAFQVKIWKWAEKTLSDFVGFPFEKRLSKTGTEFRMQKSWLNKAA